MTRAIQAPGAETTSETLCTPHVYKAYYCIMPNALAKNRAEEHHAASHAQLILLDQVPLQTVLELNAMSCIRIKWARTLMSFLLTRAYLCMMNHFLISMSMCEPSVCPQERWFAIYWAPHWCVWLDEMICSFFWVYTRFHFVRIKPLYVVLVMSIRKNTTY